MDSPRNGRALELAHPHRGPGTVGPARTLESSEQKLIDRGNFLSQPGARWTRTGTHRRWVLKEEC